MYVLGQTLTPDSKTRVFGKAFAYGDEWFVNESVGERGDEITSLPTGNQVVPTTEPDWDYIQLKVDGIRVILSDVFLKDSGRHVLSLSVQFSLKGAFYSGPLAEEIQFLFAFEEPTQPASQLTWTILPGDLMAVLTYLEKVCHRIFKTLIAPKSSVTTCR